MTTYIYEPLVEIVRFHENECARMMTSDVFYTTIILQSTKRKVIS